MKTLSFLVLCLLVTSSSFGQPRVTISDFENLNNTQWSGSLMYINYGDGKEVTLRSKMQILIEGNKILTNIQYPDEPKANSRESIKIKKNGTYLDNEEIIEKKLEMGTMKLVTRYRGKDNNKLAVIYKTYNISENEYTVEKKVDYLNTEQKTLRNRYRYKRVSEK
ncbi:hypothetical protein [uncultured Eudoraea sp.]|uniref:hypothetical protein n=1 Tax=uncultured Eudoraea sp. TaxID=1035614 RepID=UPI0026347AF5|nr:hypothetical protein [uncultured Eudoraea sp.]